MRTLQPQEIDKSLGWVRASLIDIRDVAPEWENEHIATKISWDHEWRDNMHRFEKLYERIEGRPCGRPLCVVILRCDRVLPIYIL